MFASFCLGAVPDGQVHEKYDDAHDFRADDLGERLLSISI